MGRRGVTTPRLEFFGRAHLDDGAGSEVALPARALFLALFLFLRGRHAEATRAQAAEFLWPNQPGALTNLRQLLARLRTVERKTGLRLFESDTTSVRLRLDGVSCDLVEFQELIVGLDWSRAAPLMAVYGEGLLAAPAAPEGELSAWVATQQAGFRGALVTALCDLLGRADARANTGTAQAVASRLLSIDPYQEQAYRALMRFFAATGQTGRVAETYEQCRLMLARDLGVSPAPETVDLFGRLVPAEHRVRESPAGRPDVHLSTVAGPVRLPRLVVLPPLPADGDNALNAVATLLLEDVTIGLCSLQTISVVAPHTSWQLGQGALDDAALEPFQIGYLVQSSLVSRGHAAGLTSKLFDARTRTILWADGFTLSRTTTARCYRELTVGIVLALADAVERAELGRFSKDQHPNAYYWNLIGQKHLRHVDLPDVRRALKAFRQSLDADPEFAPAHSGKARAFQREWLLLGRGDDSLLDAAEESGRHAVQLDHRDARGYRELGLSSLYRRRFDDSIAYYAQAELLNPQHADLIADFGDALAHSGDPAAGLRKIERAIELNPIPPEQYWWDAAGMHFQLHQYRKAIAAVDKMDHPTPALRIAAASWALLGRKDKAAKCAAAFLDSYPDFRVDHWLAIVPNRNADDTRHYELGLKAAGFK